MTIYESKSDEIFKAIRRVVVAAYARTISVEVCFVSLCGGYTDRFLLLDTTSLSILLDQVREKVDRGAFSCVTVCERMSGNLLYDSSNPQVRPAISNDYVEAPSLRMAKYEALVSAIRAAHQDGTTVAVDAIQVTGKPAYFQLPSARGLDSEDEVRRLQHLFSTCSSIKVYALYNGHRDTIYSEENLQPLLAEQAQRRHVARNGLIQQQVAGTWQPSDFMQYMQTYQGEAMGEAIRDTILQRVYEHSNAVSELPRTMQMTGAPTLTQIQPTFKSKVLERFLVYLSKKGYTKLAGTMSARELRLSDRTVMHQYEVTAKKYLNHAITIRVCLSMPLEAEDKILDGSDADYVNKTLHRGFVGEFIKTFRAHRRKTHNRRLYPYPVPKIPTFGADDLLANDDVQTIAPIHSPSVADALGL